MTRGVGDEARKGVVEVSKSELLLENLRWVLQKESKGKKVLVVREYEGGKACGASRMVEKKCAKGKALFCRVDGVLK